MFRSSLNRVLDWAERALAPIEEEWSAGEHQCAAVDDHFAACEDHEPAATPPLPHPHRRELRWERKRRPGSLPHPPAHCISPVRRKAGVRTRQDSGR
ncbi:MAG: hypothetical protein M3065_09140 [Actinomycetota bacterium]|nr:hypothetical protein [Actinomycetota bacterium]